MVMPRRVRGNVFKQPKRTLKILLVAISCSLSILVLSQSVLSVGRKKPKSVQVHEPSTIQAKVPASKNSKATATATAAMSSTSNRTRIRYKTVETGDTNILRYAAFTCKDSSSSLSTTYIGTCDEGSMDLIKHVPLSVQKWTELLLSETNLMSEFYNLLNITEWPSYFFETKGISSRNASEVLFEFVLVKSTELHNFVRMAGGSDINAFSQHWTNVPPEETCASFRNLSGDAMLVVPRRMPSTEPSAYSDLASFVRNAPRTEVMNLWTKSLQAYQGLIGSSNGRTVWFSTSGNGIAYLHMRFDSRPKYYSYLPFKTERSSFV